MPSNKKTETVSTKPLKVKVPLVYAYAFYGGSIKSGISVVKVTHDHPEVDYDKLKLYYGEIKGRWVKCSRPIETVQEIVNEKLSEHKITEMLYKLDTVEISKILKEATETSKCSTIGVYTKKEGDDKEDKEVDDKSDESEEELVVKKGKTKETKKAKDESDEEEVVVKKGKGKETKDTKKTIDKNDDSEDEAPKKTKGKEIKETKESKDTKSKKDTKKAKISDDESEEEEAPKKSKGKDLKDTKSKKKTVKADSDDDVPKAKSHVRQIVLSSDNEDEMEE
jgi:hypothetical protein